MIPNVNVDEVSQGLIGVLLAMHSAIEKFGNATIAYFLDLVPERGEKLWDRMKAFQRQNEDASFLDFVKSIVSTDQVKLFYPKECTLDPMTKEMLVSEIQGAIHGQCRTNDSLMGIYFGTGPVYEKARMISCKGCPNSRCKHHLKH